MKNNLRLFADHLSSQPMEFHDWDADSILDFLFCCYTEDHPLENEVVRCCYERMEPVFEGLPQEDSNQLFQNIAVLCNVYKRAAFTEGHT